MIQLDWCSDPSENSDMLDQAFILPYAHRGLHDAAQGVIENTTTAFEKAIAQKVGIECDLRPASDATPMVYHDLTLERLMQAEGRIDLLSPAALARLAYRGSGDRMLTLDELLELTAGRVPLLIEIKNDFVPPNLAFLARVATSVGNYPGPAALMSFDPAVISHMQQQARGVPRGLVAGRYRDTGWWSDRLEPTRRAALSALSDADRLGTAFVNYRVGDLPTPETEAIRKQRVRHVFAWTVRTSADRKRARMHADAAVFEGTIPS